MPPARRGALAEGGACGGGKCCDGTAHQGARRAVRAVKARRPECALSSPRPRTSCQCVACACVSLSLMSRAHTALPGGMAFLPGCRQLLAAGNSWDRNTFLRIHLRHSNEGQSECWQGRISVPFAVFAAARKAHARLGEEETLYRHGRARVVEAAPTRGNRH